VKRHERCRIGGSFGESEIPLLLSFFYLFSKAGSVTFSHSFVVLSPSFNTDDHALKTASGGEFDWGGTSVKA
jgi:hypothetical protein